MKPALQHVLAAAAILLIASGCGVTKQYMIPHDEGGRLIAEARGKIRLAGCVNCNMWEGQEISPRGYLPFYANDGLSVDINSSYRCFGWFIVIPLPVWGSCSSAVNAPGRQVVHIRISNEGKHPWSPKGGRVRAFKGGREVEVGQSQPFPAEIHPGESIIRAFDVGGWGGLSRRYELDLSGLIGNVRGSTFFERFTTTTFGLYLTR